MAQAARTEVIAADASDPDPAVVARAARVIADGGLVVLPTDTVYGLVCDPRRPKAVERIYEVKQRDRSLPLALLLHDMSQVTTYAQEAPDLAIRAMQHFWPGALTVVVRDRSEATAAVRGRKDTVGLRLPAHVVPRLVAGRLGCALASTSANRSTHPAAVTAEGALADLEGLVALAVDAGRAPLGEESTIVSFAVSPPRMLRLGAVSLARLREVLGEVRES